MEISQPVECNDAKLLASLEDSCRVCMAQKLKMYGIFEPDAISQSCISEKITFCTGIQIAKDDGLPTQICDYCLSNLSTAHTFKMTYIQTQEALQKLIKSNIKTEGYEDVPVYFDEPNDFFVEDFSVTDTEDLKTEKVEVEIKPEMSKGVQLRRKARTSKAIKREPGTLKPKRKAKSVVPTKSTTCLVCNIDFATKKELCEHKKTVHKKTSFVCEICGKVFRHQSSQSTHQLTHREPRFLCHHCDYKTWYRQDLVTHMRTHTGEKRFKCEYCDRTFVSSSNCLAHTRRLHETDYRREHVCDICGRKYMYRSELNVHAESHGDEKKFQCNICETRFKQRKHWRRHLLRKHKVKVPIKKKGKNRDHTVNVDNIVLESILRFDNVESAA